MTFFTLICLLISINTVLSRVIDVQFTNLNQTVLLFDKQTIDSNIKFQIVRSAPHKCAISYTLIDNHTNVYLRYHQESDTSSCLLELNNEISLNVNVMLNKTLVLDLHSDQINELKLNIEYIFKIFNDSDYGLIKTDMKPNGIVSIVRIVYPKNDSIELKITSFNKYFQIKMFLANFYMIRLSDNVQELYEQHESIDLGLEAFLLQSRDSILTQRLRFKIVDQNQLKIKVPSENKMDFKITQRKNDMGCYVTKVVPGLDEKLFEKKNLKELYMKKFIRMKIEASNIQDDIFDLEPIAGHLAMRAGWRSKLKIDQTKFTINVSIFDTKKFFKSSSIHIRVDLLDSNDNKPKYSKQEYEIDVYENQLKNFVSMPKHDQKYFLVFNQSANDFDHGLNSLLDYMIVYVKLNNRYFNSNFFLMEKQSGKLWLNSKIFNTKNLVNIFNLKIMVKDNAKSEFKYNYVNLNLKVVKSSFDVYMKDLFTNRVDQVQNYYFHVDLECLIQIGQLKIGNIYLKLINSRNLNIKLSELYERFFNLTLGADGSLSLSLNENFLNNKLDLKRLNYLETSIMFSNAQSQSKEIRIFIQFKSNQQVDFDQKNYYLYLDENLNTRLVAKLTTKCVELSQAELIGYGDKFKVISKNNFVELWNTQKLDAEIEQNWEFSVIAKCKQNDNYYLIWTNVTVHINDLNDNYPIFVNPPLSGYTFHKILSYSEIKQDQDILLTYFQAYDADTTSTGVKYSLNRTSLKISSMCQQLFKLRLNLNKINGELSVSNLYTESSYRHCQFYYEIEISASDSVNVRSLLFFIKIDLFGPDLVFYKQIEYSDDTTHKIEFDLINFFQIEKCWVNDLDAGDLMSYYLSENNVYFYLKNSSLNVKKFECELSSDLIKSKHLIPWLMIEFRELKNFSHLSSQYFDVTRQSILNEDNFILNLKNLSLSEPNDELKIFSLSDMTDETWRHIFSLNSFSADLKTQSQFENYLETVKIVDLITLVVEIKTFKIGVKNRLVNKQVFKVYLNVLEKQHTSRIEQLVEEFNHKFINISINYINQTSNLKLINFGEKNLNKQNQQLEVFISSVLETYLHETNQIDEISADSFKIIESEKKMYLVYDSLNVKQNEIFTNFRLYFLTLNLCSKEIYNLNSFSQECSLIRLNLKILFDLEPSYLVFSSNSIRKTVIQIEDLFYDQNLEIMSPNIPLMDLKSHIPGSNLINWESNSKIKFNFLSDLSIQKFFVLNEQDGTLYINDFNLLPSNFTCEVMISNLDKILSSLTIVFDKIEIKTNLVRNITLKERSNNFWSSLLNLDLEKINPEIFSKIEFVKRCENMEETLCDKLFKVEKSNGSLAINQTLAFSHRIERAKIYLEISILDHKIANYNIFLNFLFTNNFNSVPLIDSDLVNFINSSQVKHKIFILNKKKLGQDVYIDMERVKNLNSNSIVLALDYRIQVDNSENYYIEIPFAFAIEPNQLYSFDFVTRYRNNGSVVESFLKQSIYVIRLGSPVLFTAPKKYFNTFGEKKFKIDLKEFQNNKEKRSDLWHTKFIINHISTSDTNFIAHSSLDSSYLQFNLDNQNVGPNIFLKLNKFVIDKLSLEIIKVFEYHILIETFDWDIRKPSAHELIKKYFFNLKVLKSEIINNSSNNQYDFFICKIGSNFSSRKLIEFSIVYNENIPFAIEKYTGKLYYLPSEDQKYFNPFYEKVYIFHINAVDLNGKLAQIIVQFKLFDDDPICYFGDKLNQIIEVSGDQIERQIIGKIDLKNAFQKNIHKNFTELLNTLSQWKIDYKLKNSDKYFSIHSKTGLILAKNLIEKKNKNFYQLTVEINSKFRQKTISIQMFVYVVFELEKNSMIENFQFERRNFKFISTSPNYQFNLNTKKAINNNVDRRFRLISQNDLNCQVNSLTGIVNCQNSGLKKIYFYVVVFNSKNVNYFDMAKVEVKFLNKLSSNESTTEPKGTFDLQFNLEYLPKIGDLIVNIFDLIKEKYEVSIDHDQYRLFLINNNSNSQSIQFYFNLNEANGDLILKNSLLNYKTCINQYVKLVSKSLDYFKVFKLSVKINLERISGCWTSFTYSDLVKTKSDFIQIGSVYQSSGSVKYYLENSKLIKSISNNYNLVLSEKVEFAPQIDSLIYVDPSNGALSLNKTMLIEKKIVKLNFFVSSIKSNANLKNIQNRYMCRFGINFEKNLGDSLKFLGINKIDLDVIIDVNQVSIGDTIFKVRDLISSSGELFNSSFKIVSDFKVPFKINEKNGDIFLNSYTWFKSQEISVSILVDSFFEFEIRFFPQSMPRSIFFDQDICHRNSTFSRINNHLNVRKSIYKLKIGLDDFNQNRPILSFQTADFEKDVLFMFVNNQQGLPKFFTSLLKLNEINGEISAKIDGYKDFMDFCTYYSSIQVNTLINVKAYNAKNSNIFAHVVIQIEPDCGPNFINSRFSQPFYFVKVSDRAKVGNLLAKVSINLTSYKIKYTLCNNESLIRIDEETGDVYLNDKLEKKRYQIDICAMIVNKMISKPIKVETKLIIFVQDVSKKPIVGVGFKGQKKFSFDFYTREINNLRTNLIYFEKTKNIKLVSSTPGLFAINSSNGWLKVNYLSKNLPSSKLHRLKVFHSHLEIFDFKIKFKETTMDLFISRTSKIGSLVLNLKNKFKDSYQFIVLSSEYEDFLNYDRTNGMVYLAKYPTNFENQFFYYAKFGSAESHFYILKLRIKFLNILFSNIMESNLSIYKKIQQNSHYFFNYKLKLFDSKYAIVGKINEKSSIESQKCLTDNKLVTELFSLGEFGQVYINNSSRIIGLDCQMFEINARSFTEKNVTIQLQIENFMELKYLNMTSLLDENYSTILVTDLLQRESYSINIYDLIKFKQNLNRIFDKQFVLVSDTKLLKNFSFDLNDGLLSLNLSSNFPNGSHLIEFQFVLKKEIFIKILNLKVFVLNGFISGDEYFLNSSYAELELTGDEEFSLTKFLTSPISNKRIKTLRNSGIRLLMKNHEPFKFDPLSGSIRVAEKIQQNFSRIAEFSVCFFDLCQKTKLKLNYRPSRIKWFDEMKKYYQHFRPKIEVDLNFKNFNPFLFKLKTFGNSLDYFKVNTKNVVIEPGTGLVFLNIQRENIEKLYFLILNNSSVLAEYSVSFLPVKKKLENAQVQIEVFQSDSFSNLNPIYIGNLGQKPLECQNWDAKKNFKIDHECNMYLIGNFSSQSMIDNRIRAFDPMSQFKSKFFNIKIFLKNLKIYSTKYLIEFKYAKNCDENTKAELYKFLKSKFSFDLLDIENFVETKSLVFLISSSENLQNLNKYQKYTEKMSSIVKSSVYIQNSPYQIIKSDSNDQENLITDTNLILSVQKTYEIFSSQDLKFKNPVKFEKFSYQHKKNLNFSIQNFIKFKIWFKIDGDQLEQFLFSSKFQDRLITCEIVKNGIKIFHNLDESDKIILLENQMNFFQWYQLEIQLDNNVFFGLKKWQTNKNMFNLIDTYKKNDIAVSNYFINDLYVGGLPASSTSFSYVDTYYSDKLSFSRFRVNSIDILQPIVQNYDDFGDKKIFKISQNYKNFLDTEQYLFEKKKTNINTFAKGFNLTIKFQILNNTHSTYELIKSQKSLIIFDFDRKKVEFYILNNLISSIDLRTLKTINKLELYLKPGLVKLELNGLLRETSFSYKNLNFDLFKSDLFLSEYVSYQDILVNSKNFKKFYFNSNVKFSGKNEPKLSVNVSNYQNSDVTYKPSLILIITLCFLLLASLAVLSILMFILVQKRKLRKNINFSDAKFNSRNPLEISVNSSTQNSPASSNSDFTTSLETQINPNRETQQNYFEYDSALANSTSIPLFNSLLAIQPTKSSMNNSTFNQSDLEHIKSFLNWTADIYQFSSLLNELEKFSNHNHTCSINLTNNLFNSINYNNGSTMNDENILGSLNLYEEYDKQTFV